MKNATAIFLEPPSVDIYQVPGEAVAQDWKIYRPLVVRALEFDQDPIELAEVFQHIRMNHWLAIAIKLNGELCAFCIVEQSKAHRGYKLDVLGLAGEGLQLWLAELIDVLKNIAAIQHCKSIRLRGRLGWLRELKGYGFKAVSQTLDLEL